MISGKTPDSTFLNDFKFENPRQIAVYNYLKNLVSGGAASFYKDACRIMATNPSFETTTHLIGHMLREVDVSMLGVLEGITETIPKGTDDRHKKQIKIILKALEIPEEDPIAQAWLEVTTAGLHGLAHRSGLGAARPINNDFLEAWEKTNLILYGILERFESHYLDVFEVLNELSQKNPPSASDVKKFKENIPNNRVAHDHFFGKISSLKWLPLLESEGFFKNPPLIERDIDGGERHPTWPVFIYLLKIVDTEPEAVTKILSQIPDTENGNVKSGAIEIAIKLPREKKLELIPSVIKWMNADSQFFNAVKSIEFIQSLNSDSEIDIALSVSMELLEFVPENNLVIPETGYIPSREPKTRIDRWHYVRFLQDTFVPIAKKNPSKSLPHL